MSNLVNFFLLVFYLGGAAVVIGGLSIFYALLMDWLESRD